MQDKILIILMRVLAVMLLLIGLPFLSVSFFFIFIPALGAFIFYLSIKKSRAIKAAAKKAKEDEIARQEAIKAELARQEELAKQQAKEEAEKAARDAELAKKRAEEAEERARLKREMIQRKKEDPKEMERLTNMCESLTLEYKALLNKYKDLSISDEDDIENMVYILKECYRKMDVMASTAYTYGIKTALDPQEQQEKIERKARTFINSYIKQQREDYFDDYMIDVMQFSDDLDFIYDYIYVKDEKLNKE